ncbi:hypothetical protein [Pseudooceanicola algae]|uniref:Uncharacterized protein n=1 Tax=Pseudooceanicola algae TaxID=1537215 RepID=A0A418SFI1_9RHOB|nr:hypothetical protein [Pseudooceanicola algae]QPM89861.1 hypothetical protein PSAL_010900 [Pseudooceanicola algae]
MTGFAKFVSVAVLAAIAPFAATAESVDVLNPYTRDAGAYVTGDTFGHDVDGVQESDVDVTNPYIRDAGPRVTSSTYSNQTGEADASNVDVLTPYRNDSGRIVTETHSDSPAVSQNF